MSTPTYDPLLGILDDLEREDTLTLQSRFTLEQLTALIALRIGPSTIPGGGWWASFRLPDGRVDHSPVVAWTVDRSGGEALVSDDMGGLEPVRTHTYPVVVWHPDQTSRDHVERQLGTTTKESTQ